MTAAVLPRPWRVELIGLANAVEFSHPDGRRLVWTDGTWWSEYRRGRHIARGIPAADDMKAARRVGTEWLARMEQDLLAGGGGDE